MSVWDRLGSATAALEKAASPATVEASGPAKGRAKPVLHPGAHGSVKWYRTEAGEVRYGTPPAGQHTALPGPPDASHVKPGQAIVYEHPRLGEQEGVVVSSHSTGVVVGHGDGHKLGRYVSVPFHLVRSTGPLEGFGERNVKPGDIFRTALGHDVAAATGPQGLTATDGGKHPWSSVEDAFTPKTFTKADKGDLKPGDEVTFYRAGEPAVGVVKGAFDGGVAVLHEGKKILLGWPKIVRHVAKGVHERNPVKGKPVQAAEPAAAVDVSKLGTGSHIEYRKEDGTLGTGHVFNVDGNVLMVAKPSGGTAVVGKADVVAHRGDDVWGPHNLAVGDRVLLAGSLGPFSGKEVTVDGFGTSGDSAWIKVRTDESVAGLVGSGEIVGKVPPKAPEAPAKLPNSARVSVGSAVSTKDGDGTVVRVHDDGVVYRDAAGHEWFAKWGEVGQAEAPEQEGEGTEGSGGFEGFKGHDSLKTRTRKFVEPLVTAGWKPASPGSYTFGKHLVWTQDGIVVAHAQDVEGAQKYKFGVGKLSAKEKLKHILAIAKGEPVQGVAKGDVATVGLPDGSTVTGKVYSVSKAGMKVYKGQDKFVTAPHALAVTKAAPNRVAYQLESSAGPVNAHGIATAGIGPGDKIVSLKGFKGVVVGTGLSSSGITVFKVRTKEKNVLIHPDKVVKLVPAKPVPPAAKPVPPAAKPVPPAVLPGSSKVEQVAPGLTKITVTPEAKLDPSRALKEVPKPDFMSWGSTGKPGPSASVHFNKANQAAVDAIAEAAKTGDVDAIKAVQVPDVHKDSGEDLGTKTSVMQHPSVHVKGYAEGLIARLNEQLHPTAHVRYELAGEHPLQAVSAGIKPLTGHALKAHLESGQKIAKYADLGAALPLSDEAFHALFPESWAEKKTHEHFQAETAKVADKIPSDMKSAINSLKAYSKNKSVWEGNENGQINKASQAIHEYGFHVPPQATIHRHISLDGSQLKQLLASQGHVLQEMGWSHSSPLSGTWTGNVHLKMRAAPGVKALHVGPGGGISDTHGGEHESGLPKHTRLWVQKVTPTLGGAVVDAIILPHEFGGQGA